MTRFGAVTAVALLLLSLALLILVACSAVAWFGGVA